MLHFKEDKNTVLSLTYCLGMVMNQYENSEKSIFITKGSFMYTEIGESFYANVAVQKYKKKYDFSNDFECSNCHKIGPIQLGKIVTLEKLIINDKLCRLKENNKLICTDEKELIEKYLQNTDLKPLLVSRFKFENKSKKTSFTNDKYPLKVSVFY